MSSRGASAPPSAELHALEDGEQSDGGSAGAASTSSSEEAAGKARPRAPLGRAQQKLACLSALAAALLLVVPVSWALGAAKTWDAEKWVAMCCTLLLTNWAAWSDEAPPAWRRRLYAAVIPVAAAVVATSPWLFYGSAAACDAQLQDPVKERWAPVHFGVDAACVLLLTPLAMASAAIWHRPSRYARGGILCIQVIWLMKSGWATWDLLAWCGDPLRGRLSPVVFGVSFLLLSASLFAVNMLIVLRVQALEASMGERLSGPIRWVVVLYCGLFLADDAFEGRRHFEWLDASPRLPVLGLTAFRCTWVQVALPLFPLLLALLVLRAFTRPLRLLRAEAQRTRGAPRAEAAWAARTLRCERAAALCVLLTAELKLCYQPFSWARSELGATLLSIVGSLDDVCNAAGVAVMCGVLCRCNAPPPPPARLPCPKPAPASSAAADPQWERKVHELAGRGFALGALLDFFELLLGGEVMPSFVPERSTTNDVVRQAIIPLSRRTGTDQGGHALASVWNRGQPVLAQRMVTHNWSNVFLHLVAAIVADGLEASNDYDAVAVRLTESGGVAGLREALRRRGTLGLIYWVCAFSINQHASICGGFGPPPPECTQERLEWESKRHDSVTLAEFQVCACGERKYFNQEPLECELNKFDDLMAYLFRTVRDFAQVVAVDASFELFSRAWCVAELVEAEIRRMPQRVKTYSRDALDDHYDKLSLLDVRECRASRVEDKDLIMRKIADVQSFNARLQWLIFGTEGLFGDWANTRDRAAVIGRVARRVARHANSGPPTGAPLHSLGMLATLTCRHGGQNGRHVQVA